MDFIDKNAINIDKIIKRRIGNFAKSNQNKIEQALQKQYFDPLQFIRKSYGDPMIKAYKKDPFENDKNSNKINNNFENKHIRKVLCQYDKEYENNHDSYKEHKVENDKFYEKYWNGKNIQPPEKLKKKDNDILEDIYMGYKNKGYKTEKIKKLDGIFKQSPLLLNERGIQRFYNENRYLKDSLLSKEFLFIEKIHNHVNELIHKNKDKKEAEKNAYFLDEKFNKVNKSVDLYEAISTKKLYKQMILNELKNYELKQDLNNVITEESENEVTNFDRIRTKESKKTVTNNYNKFSDTISIRDNVALDTLPTNSKFDKEMNDQYNQAFKRHSTKFNVNISKISRQNTDINIISHYNTNINVNVNNNINGKQNNNFAYETNGHLFNIENQSTRQKQMFKQKSIFERNGDSITNFDANNTKRSGITTINNDFKIFRQSGFIINSDFVKKDETRYNGISTKKYNELENIYEKVSKKDTSKEEIMNYFLENPKKAFQFDENKKIEPNDILRSIKEIKKKINDVDVEEKFAPILEKVANYGIDPEELAKVKELDKKIQIIDFNLVKSLNKIKK